MNIFMNSQFVILKNGLRKNCLLMKLTLKQNQNKQFSYRSNCPFSNNKNYNILDENNYNVNDKCWSVKSINSNKYN